MKFIKGLEIKQEYFNKIKTGVLASQGNYDLLRKIYVNRPVFVATDIGDDYFFMIEDGLLKFYNIVTEH